MISRLAISNFIKHYHMLLIIMNSDFHDRFLIIDDKYLYHVEGSIKDVGNKCFAICEMDSNNLKLLFSVI